MKVEIHIGTDTILHTAKMMMHNGDLSKQQYEQMLRRNEEICRKDRFDTVII